jgi:hypothetical protein
MMFVELMVCRLVPDPMPAGITPETNGLGMMTLRMFNSYNRRPAKHKPLGCSKETFMNAHNFIAFRRLTVGVLLGAR